MKIQTRVNEQRELIPSDLHVKNKIFRMKKILLVIMVVWGTVAVYATDPYYLFSPKGIAQVEIRMLNGKNFGNVWVNGCIVDNDGNLKPNYQNEASEELEAMMIIKNSSNSSYESSELYNGKIIITGRGNTSFHNDKRGYSIDLIMSNNDINGDYIENPKTLLGMASHDKWTLVSRYDDRTIMRDMLAFWLGRQMDGLAYTPNMKYVEVTVYDSGSNTPQYRGLYCLGEKPGNRSSSRIDIKKLTTDAADQIEPRVTGGYILEVVPNDKMKDYDEYMKKFRIPGWEDDWYHHYTFNYPKSRNITEAQRNYMIQYMTDVYNTLYDDNFADQVNGYAKYIDEESFVDWYILHDLAKGTDNLFHASIFLHKDRNEKLKMSSPWDFDLSFGNVEENNGAYYEDGFHIRQTKYFNRLWEDPHFREKLKNRYDELMPIFDLVPYVLQENFKFLEERGVWQRDYNKYGKNCLEGFRYADDIKTRKGHVRYLTEWFESRKAWLYYNLAETPEERCGRMQEVRPVMRVMQPENLLSCTNTLTGFMRSGSNDYNYTYNLNKGESGRHDGYASNWYEIKRNDGEYTVEIVDENGCVSIPSLPVEFCKEIVYETPAFEPPSNTITPHVKAEKIVIYPNPAHDYIFIESDKDVFAELFDINGLKLKQTKNNYFNVSNLTNGIYFIKLTSGNTISVQKIIVIKD